MNSATYGAVTEPGMTWKQTMCLLACELELLLLLRPVDGPVKLTNHRDHDTVALSLYILPNAWCHYKAKQMSTENPASIAHTTKRERYLFSIIVKSADDPFSFFYVPSGRQICRIKSFLLFSELSYHVACSLAWP